MMRRHSSSQSGVEAIEPVPSLYFRAPSPPRSRSARTLPPLNMPLARPSASASINHRSERERRSPTSPIKVSSGSSRVYASSSVYRNDYYTPQPKASSSSSGSSPSHSRSHSHSHSHSRRQTSGSATYPSPPQPHLGERSRTSPSSIPHLREALNSLESQMANLMFERRMLESRLEQAVRLQSPVHRLPGELLGTIFEIGVHYLEEEDAVLLSTLMLVCREWTDVALNTPALWSRILIENAKSIPKARRKLARSKSVPLDISIQFSPHLDTPGTQTVTELVVHALDILRPAMWRWRSFRIAVPHRAHAHAALTQCREPAPLLEELSVQIHHVLQEDRYAKPPLPLFQGQLPRLRSCAFTSFNFGWDGVLVSRLRVLKLGGFWNGFAPSVGTLVSILRACPDLEELSLRNMSDVESSGFCADFEPKESHAAVLNNAFFPKESEMVCLPRLKKATFYYAGVERMQAVFSQLLFPALERVEFSYMDNLTPILKHLKRQSFISLPLVHLRVESCLFNELKLVRLLRRLPTLQTLELVDVEDVSSNFLSGLSTPPVAQEWICPRLETLNFDGCSTVDWDALRGLVESRLPANSSRMLNPPNASFARNNTTFVSSASSYAAQQRLHHPAASVASARVSRASSAASYASVSAAAEQGFGLGAVPRRLRVVDLTRCHQISKEMVQWLRMYVAEVRCESMKSYLGEFGFSK